MGRAVISIAPMLEKTPEGETYTLNVNLSHESTYQDDVTDNWGKLAMAYAHAMMDELDATISTDLWMIDSGTNLIIENESERLAHIDESMLPIQVSRQDELKLYVSLYFPKNSMTIGGLATPSAQFGWLLGQAVKQAMGKVAL